MKSIWTPGPVQWNRPGRSHEPELWTLWGITVALLCLWLLGIAFGYTFGGWIHALAGAAIVMGALCAYGVFRYGEFLERPFFQRFRFRRRRASGPSSNETPPRSEPRR